MSARAQREMMKRDTYREEHGLQTNAPRDGHREQSRQHYPMQSVDSGYGSSSRSEDHDDFKTYSLDLNRNAGQRPARPARPVDYPSDASNMMGHLQTQPYGAQQYQSYSHGGHAEQGPSQPLAKRLSQRIGKRLSMASFLGEPAPPTEADEKRLEEEKMLKAKEERDLDEEEREMLKRGLFNWSELRSWRFWIRKEWWSAFSPGEGIHTAIGTMADSRTMCVSQSGTSSWPYVLSPRLCSPSTTIRSSSGSHHTPRS